MILVYLLANCKYFITLKIRVVITYWGYSVVYTNLSCTGINAWRWTELLTGRLNAFRGLNCTCFFLSDTLICWNREIPVPWNEPSADVELGLWTMLPITAVVKRFCEVMEGTQLCAVHIDAKRHFPKLSKVRELLCKKLKVLGWINIMPFVLVFAFISMPKYIQN